MAETELGLGTDLVGEALDELGEVEADPAQDLGHGAAVGDLQALHLLAQAGTCNNSQSIDLAWRHGQKRRE